MKINLEQIKPNFSASQLFESGESDISNFKDAKPSEQSESSAVSEGIKILEKNGYKVDNESISSLKKILTGSPKELESKLEALELSLKKDMPLKDALLLRLQNFSKVSILDFLDGDIDKTDNNKLKKPEYNPHYKKNIIEKTNQTLEKLFSFIDFEENNYSTDLADTDLADKENILIKNEIKEPVLRTKNTDNFSQENFENIKDKDKVTYKINSESLKILESDYNDKDSFNEDILRISEYLQACQNINESFSASMILETKITPKLAELKDSFNQLKKELSVDLFKISNENSSLEKNDKVELLSKNIEKLDNAIMKSEMSLYIDLKGERELIKISSDLQIARDFLHKGEFKKAENILKTSLNTLKEMNYNPSIKKAFAVVNTDLSSTEDKISNLKDLSNWISDGAERFSQSEKSVSSLVNYLRNLGLNNEVEEFINQFKDEKSTELKEFKNLENLKTLLGKIIENTDNNADSKIANKIVEHLEGNQLRNKIVDSKDAQNVALEVPLNLNGTIKSVKVFINSPQKMLKLDWENFDMFFAINTKKLGDLGIRVKAVQRNLKVSILNDKASDLKQDKRFSENFKKDVEQFGFNLVNMVLKVWNEKKIDIHADNLKSDITDNSVFIPNKDGNFDIKI